MSRIASFIGAVIYTVAVVVECIARYVPKPFCFTQIIAALGMWLSIGTVTEKRRARTPLAIAGPILLLLGGLGSIYFLLHKG